MAGKRNIERRIRYGTRKLVQKAIGSAEAGASWTTAEIRKEVNKISGRRIPDQSLYGALRTLVRRRVLSAKRKGRELVFTASGGSKSAAVKSSPSRKTAAPAAPAPAPEMAAAMDAPATTADAAAAPSGILHKLAVGEAAILHVGETHIETATNVHGKVVLERHPRPASDQ